MQTAEKSEERNGSEIHFSEKKRHLNSITIYFVAISIIRASLFICASPCSRQLQNRSIANLFLVQVLSVSLQPIEMSAFVHVRICEFCCFSWNLL